MNETTFKNARVGDRVWSSGLGEPIFIRHEYEVEE